MLDFSSDYTRLGHPRLLDALFGSQGTQFLPYGTDTPSGRAAAHIRDICRAPKAGVHFLLGGTQTNQLAIDALLRSFEGVIAADTGHVSAHEAGAIEHVGHKVLTIPHQNGKLTAGAVERYCEAFYADGNHTHMVFPGMVYLSHPTEYGTLYSRAELERIAGICRAYSIPLYLDGARLGYALMSPASDLPLPEIARLCDVFYIGGTKVGALCGEAVVFTRENRPAHFLTSVKKRGALLAKGRLLGVQFDALFTDDLYLRIGRHAIEMARQLEQLLREAGCVFALRSPTNQQFIILENRQLEQLRRDVAFSFWEKADETHTVIRLATSWSTTQADLDALRAALRQLS